MSRTRKSCSLVLLALFCSCAGNPNMGYTFSSAYDSEIRTIAVPIFENTTFSHGLETLLTDAIVKEIHRTTPWGVTGSNTADTTILGTISDVRLRMLDRDSESGFASEMALEIEIDFQWRDNKSGQIILTRKNFRGSDNFVPGRGVREPIETGEQAAVEQLASSIVAELRSDW